MRERSQNKDHVFISYVRENFPQVERLAADLRRAGLQVWLDRDSLMAGERWAEAIVDAIKHGAYVLPCFSRDYLLRDRTYMDEELWVIRSVLVSRVTDRSWCIPLILDQLSPESVGLTHDKVLGALQSVAMLPDWGDGLRRLLGTLSPERSFGNCLNSLPPVTGESFPTTPLLALDFGTSNSLLAFRDEKSQWIPVRAGDGRSFFPSVITFATNWDWWVGTEAIEAAQRHPDRCVQNVKRLLAKGGEVSIGHKRFDAATLASLIIRYMKECAKRQLGVEISKISAAFPVTHGFRQRRALRDACQLAGLQVERMVGESSAGGILSAQWATQSGHKEDVTVLVVDVGGGTTDISLVEVVRVEGEWQFEVLNVSGDKELGGIDYDAIYHSFLLTRFVQPLIDGGMPWSLADSRRLALLATQVKHQLSNQVSCHVVLHDVELRAGEPSVLEMTVTRSDVEADIVELDQRLLSLLEPFETYLRSAILYDAPFAAVLLAGQGAKHWSIARLLRNRFLNVELVTDYQDSAVVQGLAIQSAILDGRCTDHLLLDRTNMNIGVLCSSVERVSEDVLHGIEMRFDPISVGSGQWVRLVEKDQNIPWKVTEIARATGPGTVVISIGEWPTKTTEVDVLASITCILPSGESQLELTTDINANREINFSVALINGGKRKALGTAKVN